MHEEIRVPINFDLYSKAFSEWKRSNKDKNSVKFDEEIGIGSWKRMENKSTVKIKDHKKFFLAKLKYDL